MANTSALYVRLDPQLKSDAESILSQLGISPSSMIQMLYKQIILHRGIPFDVTLPVPSLPGMGLSEQELQVELQKGLTSLQAGRSYSETEADRLMAQRYGI